MHQRVLARQYVALHHAPPGDPRILDNAPVAVLLGIFRRTLQRKNMMAANYRHIGGLENRLARHYSRFSASGRAAPLAAQSLARRKSRNGGSNRRSWVRKGHPSSGAMRVLKLLVGSPDCMFEPSAR